MPFLSRPLSQPFCWFSFALVFYTVWFGTFRALVVRYHCLACISSHTAHGLRSLNWTYIFSCDSFALAQICNNSKKIILLPFVKWREQKRQTFLQYISFFFSLCVLKEKSEHRRWRKRRIESREKNCSKKIDSCSIISQLSGVCVCVIRQNCARGKRINKPEMNN